jgi:uncharacterized protein YjbI with pentapeptide repeats
MSEQDGTQPSAKQRSRRQTNKRNSTRISALQHPANDDKVKWQEHWEAQGQPWRIEPEIDPERQKYLAERRNITPDIEKGIYPFKGIKLGRADVEWLLATHESGGRRGPVEWSDESQREREGLDLRGADLRGEDLSRLPLARMVGGLGMTDNRSVHTHHRKEAAVLLNGANLRQAHLEGVLLYAAEVRGAGLSDALLQKAEARWAWMEGSRLGRAHLEGANLHSVHLEGTTLAEAHLNGTNLRSAFFDPASKLTTLGPKEAPALVSGVRWGGVDLTRIDWSQVSTLGDEESARKQTNPDLRLSRTLGAMRAYRNLAIELREQGLDDAAGRFTYRGQVLQRKIRWMQRDFGRWTFSMFLALLTGYGYYMWRIVIAYLLVVSLCAGAYFVIGMYHPPHLTLLQAFLESITAFHGRVFSQLFTPDAPQIWVTAFEAIAGLIIESVFIAMLTQRFFGK